MATNNTNNENENENEGGNNEEKNTYSGMFNFQEIMDSFYNYKPSGDDEMGSAIKHSFASNMIQSAFDKEMAKEMAEFQNALGQSNMQVAAQLELANNSSMMEQEFGYNMAGMEAQMGFQNEFANAQFERDVAMIGAVGEDLRETADNQGYIDRLNEMNKQAEQRLTDSSKIGAQSEADIARVQVEGGEQRLTDTNRLQTQGSEDRKTVETTAREQRDTDTNRITTEGSEQRATDSNRITTEGSEQRLTDTNRITNEGDQQRQTDSNRITTEGDETRKTADFANRLEAKTRADQSKYSRSMARAF